tara:strand:+ start:730 stop:831 length:102 start_codon:yes stop_codon:yes gene_type:complete
MVKAKKKKKPPKKKEKTFNKKFCLIQQEWLLEV